MGFVDAGSHSLQVFGKPVVFSLHSTVLSCVVVTDVLGNRP